MLQGVLRVCMVYEGCFLFSTLLFSILGCSHPPNLGGRFSERSTINGNETVDAWQPSFRYDCDFQQRRFGPATLTPAMLAA